MRKLVVIAIAGIAIVAVAIHFMRSAATTPAAASAPAQSQASSHEASVEMTDTRTPRASTDSESSPSVATPQTEDEQILAACSASWERKTKREQAARDAESKDPAWAYPMEQKLREVTTRAFQASEIEVISIDCKTNFCEIIARGFAPETSDEFNKAMEALSGQPWNDFTGYSFVHDTETGKGLHTARVTRRQSKQTPRAEVDDMQRAVLHAEEQALATCAAQSAERQERERAARDAEPRDSSWADPMEQLLRQHITAQLVKHPVATLEIACRARFCTIKASGKTLDSQLAFQKVSQEAAQEAWSDLLNSGYSGGSIGDDWQAEVTLDRRSAGR